MRALGLLLILAFLSLASAGCGQKGPLYMPEEPTEQQPDNNTE